MNILFTDYCNLNCSYCFAKGKVSRSPAKKNHISLEDLATVIAFARRSGERKIGILGGEPTLHPSFVTALRMVIDAGLVAALFTNGMIGEKTLAALKKIDPGKLRLIVNTSPPDFYTRPQRRLLERTLRALNDKVMLGHTIHRADFDGRFLIDYVRRFRLIKNIRLGLSSPLMGAENAYVPMKDAGTTAARIVSFARRCDRDDISIGFDCGFRLCAFSAEQIGKLFYYNAPLRIVCRPVIDVGPDLAVWSCFVTSGLMNRRLAEFKNAGEIRDFYHAKFRTLRATAAPDQCRSCKHFKRDQCTGGCLGHILHAFEHAPQAGTERVAS